MEKDWQKIRRIRTDVSDYVLHCTRAKVVIENDKYVKYTAFDILKQILWGGFFRATFAIVEIKPEFIDKPTVRGPYPAVCFTEQPLQFFAQSIVANHRYTKFAVAIRKDELFDYGGRPVIYSDSKTLEQLPDDLKYLWVSYDPTAIWKRAYPIDFTHEREWRVRPSEYWNMAAGIENHPDVDKIIPIQLPSRSDSPSRNRFTDPHFVILVDTEESKRKLAKWIKDNRREIGKKGTYWQDYATALSAAPILSFEEIQDDEIGRIEDFLKKAKVSDF